MYHILEAITRWLSPILSFNADEIWKHIPGERSESVFLETWYKGLFPMNEDAMMDRNFWDKLIQVREAVSKELEKLRVAGGPGSSLGAEVDIWCNGDVLKNLESLDEELRFALITSYARVHPAKEVPDHAVEYPAAGTTVSIAVSPCAHTKCVRCWHLREDVGSHAEHPEICARCVSNIEGPGETREFA